MSTVTSLAEVLGAVFVLVGLSMFNKKSFMSAMTDLANSKGLSWTVGLVTFVAGVITVSLYNVWSSNWEVVITIVGWLMIIKGLFITLFPNISLPFYRKFASNSALTICAVIAVIVGVILFYLGLTA